MFRRNNNKEIDTDGLNEIIFLSNISLVIMALLGLPQSKEDINI